MATEDLLVVPPLIFFDLRISTLHYPRQHHYICFDSFYLVRESALERGGGSRKLIEHVYDNNNDDNDRNSVDDSRH